jgi:hypothetical protein
MLLLSIAYSGLPRGVGLRLLERAAGAHREERCLTPPTVHPTVHPFPEKREGAFVNAYIVETRSGPSPSTGS